jgi:DNA-directed RNA polymerase II subunit RPB3
LDVNFDKVNPTRPDQERDLSLTVSSKDLVSVTTVSCERLCRYDVLFSTIFICAKHQTLLQLSNNMLVSPAHFLNEEEQDESHDEGISIVKLGPGQHLKLKAIARMGISKEHAKWCPVAVATYRFWPIITINEEACNMLTLEQKQELVDACPDRILELDEITGNLVAVENAYELATFTEDLKMTQHAMKKRPEDDDFVTVEHSTDKFVFSVETTGAMDAEEVLMSALRVLKDKLNYLAAEVEKLKD